MKLSDQKYKRLYSALFLSVYLFFSGAGIIHEHSGNLLFSEGKGSFLVEYDGDKDPFSDGDSACLLYQLLGSLHNLHYSAAEALSKIVHADEFLAENDISFHSSYYYQLSLLRAPPSRA